MATTDRERLPAQMPARTRIVENLARHLDETVAQATTAVLGIRGYRLHGGPSLQEDVREHVRAHYDAALRAYADGRPTTREDLAPIRARAERRVAQGISISDFIHAFEVSEGPLLHRALEFTADEAVRGEMAKIVMALRQYFYMATVEAAEVYLEAESLRAASVEGVRRDLLEDLLAGRTPMSGRLLDAARAAGLDARSGCLVITALLTAPGDEHALRGAAAALSRATASAMPPLAVVRGDNIVVVLRAPGDGTGPLAKRLEEVQRRLAANGSPLAVGMSTVHRGLEGVAIAYREASDARERLLPSPGVVALPAMNTFEYLTWHSDATARQLIKPSIERFVTDDMRGGGVLIATLRAYFAADLNAKLVAERLHLHVNTVYYRLTKIAESAECNLHHVSDVVEILIAARLVGIE
jgi:sugar diacid utilization regulator